MRQIDADEYVIYTVRHFGYSEFRIAVIMEIITLIVI